jgi:predicted kinase
MNKGQLSADVQVLKQALAELPEPIARPFLIVISGLPGTGKSYFSRRLAEAWPCLIVESDALRKALFPVPSYNARESECLFQALHLLIEELLSKGIPVLLDATNLIEYHREHLYRIADRLGLKLIIVRVEAPAEVVRERLQRRAQGTDFQDNSDAGWTIYQRMKPKVEQIRRRHFAVNTARDITPVINKIIRELKR